MIYRTVLIARGALVVTWLSLMTGLGALIALPHVVPHLDREVYIVRGSSMEPAIPLGALILVKHTHGAEIATGDVITYRSDAGTVVTHRVVDVVPDDPAVFQTKGDASQDIDPRLVATSSLIGVVDVYLPGAGFVLGMLPTATGTVGVIGLLGGLLLAIWFTDELLLAQRSGQATRRGALTEAPG